MPNIHCTGSSAPIKAGLSDGNFNSAWPLLPEPSDKKPSLWLLFPFIFPDRCISRSLNRMPDRNLVILWPSGSIKSGIYLNYLPNFREGNNYYYLLLQRVSGHAGLRFFCLGGAFLGISMRRIGGLAFLQFDEYSIRILSLIVIQFLCC